MGSIYIFKKLGVGGGGPSTGVIRAQIYEKNAQVIFFLLRSKMLSLKKMLRLKCSDGKKCSDWIAQMEKNAQMKMLSLRKMLS